MLRLLSTFPCEEHNHTAFRSLTSINHDDLLLPVTAWWLELYVRSDRYSRAVALLSTLCAVLYYTCAGTTSFLLFADRLLLLVVRFEYRFFATKLFEIR